MSRVIIHRSGSVAPVEYEVFDKKLQPYASGLLEQTIHLELEPQHYFVRVGLPDGQWLTTPFAVVEDKPTEITLDVPASSHAWLDWHQSLGDIPSIPRLPTAEETPPDNTLLEEFLPNTSFSGLQAAPTSSPWDDMVMGLVVMGLVRYPAFGKTSPWTDRITRFWRRSVSSQASPEIQGISAAGSARLPLPSPEEPVWIQKWHFRDGDWSLAELTIEDLESDPRMGIYLLRCWTHEDYLTAIQMGGKTVPWRIVMLPPTPNQLELLIHPSTTRSERNDGDGGVTLKVTIRNENSEKLLRAMVGQQFVALGEQLGLEVVDEAEEMLRRKRQNPAAAAVAGYYLLRSMAYERMHEWPRNFATWFEWLPDAAIIYAWQLLRRPENRDPATARRELLKAARYGLPVYTLGVRYLIDGLARFADEAYERGEQDVEVETALKRIYTFGAALDWNSIATTYYGRDPGNPKPSIIQGVPEDRQSTLFWIPPLKG